MTTKIEHSDIADRVRTHNALTYFSSTDVRFWRRVVESTTGCWEWQGAVNSRGYGCLGRDRKPWLAHRYAFTLVNGPIPEGMQVDHLCKNTICVRPLHLEAVTPWENNRRSDSPTAINLRRSHCTHGHELTPANTRVRKDGRRACIVCQRRHSNAWHRAHTKRALREIAKGGFPTTNTR